jgi:hypothetical protein
MRSIWRTAPEGGPYKSKSNPETGSGGLCPYSVGTAERAGAVEARTISSGLTTISLG